MQLGSGFLALGEPGTCTSRPLEGGGGQITIEQNVSIFFAPIAGRNLGWNPEKYEIVMARTPPGKYANYNSNVTFAVSIDGIETLADKPAIAVLNQMVGIVDRVCEATEAECRRIGLIK
jgi:hypothetical protein